MAETCIEYIKGDEIAYISSDERKWSNRMEKLAKQHPDEVEIMKHAEDNQGCVYARFPAKWAVIRPPKKCNLTEEEKARRAEQLREGKMSGR